MKKKILYIVSMVMAVATISSCSCSSSSNDLLDRVPADADYVALGQVKNTIENAGGTLNDEGNTVTLPAYITSAFPEMQEGVDEFNSNLQENGINYSSVAVFGYFNNDDPIIVAKINDTDKAKAFYQKNYGDPTTENGATIYTNDSDYAYSSRQECYAIADGYLYTCQGWYDSDDEMPKNRILKAIDEANNKAFSKLGVASALAKANVGGGVINLTRGLNELKREEPQLASLADQLSGYVLITGNLDGPEATVEVSLVDESGDVKSWPTLPNVNFNNEREQGAYNFFANVFNHRAAFNADMLRYMPQDINMVYGLNIGDLKWDEIITDMQQAHMIGRSDANNMRMAAVYLDSFKGSVALGVGYDGSIADLVNFSEQTAMQMSFALVVEAKDGKAQQTLSQISALANSFGSSLGIRNTGNGLEFDVPGTDMTIYLTAADNMLILANRPFTGAADNEVTRTAQVGNSPVIIAAAFNKDNTMLRELGLNYGLAAYAAGNIDKAQGKLVLKATGTSEKLLPLLIKTCINLMQNGQVMSLFGGGNSYEYGDYEYEEYYDYDDDSDYEVAEEVVGYYDYE